MAAWTYSCSIGAANVSNRLTGSLRVDIARGAARTCEFTLLPGAGALNPESWVGAAVAVEFEATPIFAGRVETTVYDPVTRAVSFTCSDGLQAKVAATAKPALLSLTGGRWNADVFDKQADRWTYAQDLISTVPRDLDCDVAGNLRASPWVIDGPPDLTWAESQFIEGSLRVDLPQLRSRKNRMSLSIEYRYPRLRHRVHNVTWAAAADPCAWAAATFGLPTLGMIEQAITDAGWTLQGNIDAGLLTAGTHMPCGLVIMQEVEQEKFCYSANWTAARRTTQSVTERYELRIDCPGSIAQSGVLEETVEFGLEEQEDAFVRDWEREPATGIPAEATMGDLGDYLLDRRSDARWQNAALVQIDKARKRLLDGMRGYRVSIDVPLDPALDTILKGKVAAMPLHGIEAEGALAGILHVMDFDAATAISTVTLECARAGSGWVATQLADLPARPATDQGLPTPGGLSTLDTHIGGAEGIPPFDEAWTGWSSNLQFPTGTAPVFYEDRFRLDMPGMAAESRDPVTFTRQKLDYTETVPAPAITLSV